MQSIVSAKCNMTIQQVDSLLDALAAHSAYSALSQLPSQPKPQSSILEKLYRDSNLSPYALALLTQIILRDLRPLLNPLPQLPARNPTAMLRLKSTAGPPALEVDAALKVWSEAAWGMYVGGRGDLDWCLDAAERGMVRDEVPVAEVAGPVIGVNVQVGTSQEFERTTCLDWEGSEADEEIPKCRKGRSVEDALSEFTGSRFADAASVVWAETKYDGYR